MEELKHIFGYSRTDPTFAKYAELSSSTAAPQTSGHYWERAEASDIKYRHFVTAISRHYVETFT
jgi:hypothetical protein